jgi:hypothetical protein
MVSAGKRSGSGVNTNNPTNSATSAHSTTACVHDGQRRSFDSTTVYGKLNLRVRVTSTDCFVFEQQCSEETHSTTRFDFLASECHSHICRIRYSEHIVPTHLQCKLNFSTEIEVILLPVAPALVHVSSPWCRNLGYKFPASQRQRCYRWLTSPTIKAGLVRARGFALAHKVSWRTAGKVY